MHRPPTSGKRNLLISFLISFALVMVTAAPTQATDSRDHTVEKKLMFAASLASGRAVVRTYTRSGRLMRSVQSFACPLRNESRDQRAKRLREVTEARTRTWLGYVRSAADRDRSGQVTLAEAETFSRRVFVGFTLASMPEADSLRMAAERLNEEPDEFVSDALAYEELRLLAELDGMKGLPAVALRLDPR